MGILPLLFLLIVSSVAVPLQEQDDLHRPWHTRHPRRSPPTRSPIEMEKELEMTEFEQLFPKSEFIFGGKPAKAGDIPIQALIVAKAKEGHRFYCGGSLISKKHVLTAAYCGLHVKSAVVILGAADLKDHNTQQSRRATKIIIHPDFGKSKDKFDNDIAILQLEKDVEINKNVRIVQLSLDDSKLEKNARAVVSGFGVFDEKKHGLSPVLRAGEVKIVENEVCTKAFELKFNDNQICAKGKGSAPGPGDGGGPLFVNHDGGLIQLGIASFGGPYDPKGEPELVFTRVSRYCKWIAEKTGKEANCNSHRELIKKELVSPNADSKIAAGQRFVSVRRNEIKRLPVPEFGFTVYVSILVEEEGRIISFACVNHPIDFHSKVTFTTEGFIKVVESNDSAVSAADTFWIWFDWARWQRKTWSFLRGRLRRYGIEVTNLAGEMLPVSVLVQRGVQRGAGKHDFTLIPHGTTIVFEPSEPGYSDSQVPSTYVVWSHAKERKNCLNEHLFDIMFAKLIIKEGGETETESAAFHDENNEDGDHFSEDCIVQLLFDNEGGSVNEEADESSRCDEHFAQEPGLETDVPESSRAFEEMLNEDRHVFSICNNAEPEDQQASKVCAYSPYIGSASSGIAQSSGRSSDRIDYIRDYIHGPGYVDGYNTKSQMSLQLSQPATVSADRSDYMCGWFQEADCVPGYEIGSDDESEYESEDESEDEIVHIPEFGENLASAEKGANVFSKSLTQGHELSFADSSTYLQWEAPPYAAVGIGAGSNIMVRLGKIYLLGSVQFTILDGDEYYYHYFVEVSTDKKNWEMVNDNRNSKCRSVQEIFFKKRPVKYIRIVPTYTTYRSRNAFRIDNFTCPSDAESLRARKEKIKERIFHDPYVLCQWGLENRHDVFVPIKGNITSVSVGAEVIIEGEAEGTQNWILNGYLDYMFPPDSFQGVTIGNGNNITVKLGRIYMLDLIRLQLWSFAFGFYRYYVEVSIDGRDYDMISDNRNSDCRGWQNIMFKRRPVKFIRMVGTYNSESMPFRIAVFECPLKVEKQSTATFSEDRIALFEDPLVLGHWGLHGRKDVYAPIDGQNVATVEDGAEVITKGNCQGLKNCMLRASKRGAETA
ncbi:hypothetical protein QR680_014510 [Steinernema hermaphroditum]|uniref:Peptidase S1 domain-containing protein n=1 Tax=Steinernema hermaphroditum TaxID=289476 RepID=A0AA39IBA3_9BILA|nr:hypothetical protein QR680_014510 [Steinernema hermaphroditum]